MTDELSLLKQQVKQVESLKTAKSEQQYALITKAYEQIEKYLDGEQSQQVHQYLGEGLTICVNFTINHKAYPNEFLSSVQQFLRNVLTYISQHLSEERMSQIFRTIMDSSRLIYEYNLHLTDAHEQFTAYSYSLNPQYCHFIKSLQIGQHVDCLRLCRSTNRQNWCRAVIEEIQEESIKVRYLNELNQKFIYNIRSGHLMPYRSRSQNLDKMQELHVGQEIIATQTDKWVYSTILDKQEFTNEFNEQVIKYTIGFRKYCDEGTQIEDVTQLKYIGYNRHHDEIISFNSPRLALYDEHIVRKFNSLEQYVDDSQDILYTADYESNQFFGFLRTKLSKSFLLIQFINHFGEVGGFEKILQLTNVDILANYMSALGAIAPQFYLYYLKQYVPKLQLLKPLLLHSDEQTLRNMGREKMNLIITGFKALLDRVYIEDIRREWIHGLCLEFVNICFNCNFLDKKIIGLKLLTDILKQACADKCSQTILKWIEEQNIFENLFNHHTHLQLLERTKDLIRQYLSIDNALTPKHMALIWELTLLKDNELRPIIFKLINEVAVSMHDYHVIYFLDQISQLSEDQILVEHVQLLYEMNRYQIKNQSLIQQTIELLWKIVEYSNASKPQVEDKARGYLCDLFKNLEIKETKFILIEKLISNIKNHHVESSSLKTLSHLINSFPMKQGNVELEDTYTQEELVKDLTNKGISIIIRESINFLRLQQQIIDQNVPELTKYMSKLQERILLMKSLIKLNGSALKLIDQDFLELIWSGLILKPKFKTESDLASAWLRDLIDKDSGEWGNVELSQFYLSLLTSDSHLNENAFTCFQSMLFHINQKEHRLLKIQSTLYTTCDQYGSVIAMSNTNNESDQSPEIQLLCSSDQIIGIQYLWHIVFNSELDKAVRLLVQLEAANQQNNFIDKIISFLNTDNTQQILRCFDILQTLLNETQTKGIGTLQGLDGLVKGDQFSIVIVNEMGEGQGARSNLKVYSRMTIFELRRLIAKEYNTTWDQIKLVRNGVVVQDNENGKTLKKANIKKKSEVISVCRRKTKPIEQISLIENGKLSQKFLNVLSKLFEIYSTNGLMSKEQLSTFGVKAANDEGFKQPRRIKEIFDKYDNDNDDCLTLENFIKFYEDCIFVDKIISVVWKNLHAFGYKNDLTLINDDEVYLDEQNLPRYQLSHNIEFQKLMFKFLSSQNEIAQECWKLLCDLPVFETILQQVKEFHNWEQEALSYQILYYIKIVQSLLFQKEYCLQFIKQNGFIQLTKLLISTTNNDLLSRQIQLNLLIILNTNIVATLHTQFNNIYQIQQHVKQPMQATFEMIKLILENTYQGDNKAILRVKETEEYLELITFIDGQDLKINYLELLEYLLNIQLDITEDRLLLENRFLIETVLQLLTILIGCNLHEACEYIEQNLNLFEERYAKLLFAQKQLLIKKIAGNSLYLIYKQQSHLGYTLINLLIKLFPNDDNKESQSYFDLLVRLIQEANYSNLEFADRILIQIKEYESTESRVMMTVDRTLCGLLGIFESLAIVDKQILTQEVAIYLIRVHLFCFHSQQFILTPQKQITSDYVKSKSPEARRIVYRIVLMYMKENYQIELLELQQILYFVTIFQGFDIKLNPKTYHGYVGIRNLGCICYMNAMMQQFFMTQEFRYNMLRADDGVQIQLNKYKDQNGIEIAIDDNPIHQFQRLLAYLELSERPDFTPSLFCYSFKDYDGQSVNVSLQQDAQEFLNQFFDKLDNSLKNRGWQQFVEGVYGGNTCSQMICNGCKVMREKIDLFYTLSLKVKDVRSLQESFESMINGEVIKDYYCESCKSKNDLIKRQCLQTLPNVLIVHLQRIVFNLDIFMNEKLSSRLEFPNQLNLESFTREGLLGQELKNHSYYEYKLKGVVVHKGTAQYGHYYSLINIKGDKWLKFNDSIIEDFDIKRLSSECFGGKEGENDDFQTDQGSSTNAYVVIYERVEKQNLQIKFSDSDQQQEILQKFNLSDQLVSEDNQIVLNYKTLTQQYIPEDLYKEIWFDNHRFMLERHIYSDDFFKFLVDIAESYPFPEDYIKITNMDALPPFFGIYNNYTTHVQNPQKALFLLEQLIYTVFELVSRSAERSHIKKYVLAIVNLINIIPTSIYQIFKHQIVLNQVRIFNVLLCATDFSVRTAAQQILNHIINVIIYIHALTLDLEYLQLGEIEDATIQCEQVVSHFLIDLLQKLQNDAQKNPTKFSQYFSFWKTFIKSGQTQIRFATQLQMVSVFVDFFLEKQSPSQLVNTQYYIFQHDKKTTMASKMTVPLYSQLFQSISYLITNQEYIISENDQLCLHSPILYRRAMTECQDFDAFKNISLTIMFNNEVITRNIIEILLEEINKATYETIGQFLGLAEGMLNMYDNLQQQRIEWLLGFPEPFQQETGCPTSLQSPCNTYVSHVGAQNDQLSILNQLFENQKRYQNIAIQMIKLILQVANKNKKVFSYLVTIPPPCYLYSKYTDWFEKFLIEYQEDVNKYPIISTTIFFNKQKEVEETLTLWEQFKIIYAQSAQVGLFDSIHPIYIYGTTISTDIISSIQQTEGIYLECYESTLYFIESKPIQSTNEVFPQEILYDNLFIQQNKVDPNSNLHLLIAKPIQSNIPKPPPLPKKKDVVEGIDFSTEVLSSEEQQQQMQLAQELCNYQIDLEKNYQLANTINNEMQVEMPNIPLENTSVIPSTQQQKENYIYCDLELQSAPLLRRFFIRNTTKQQIHIQYSITVDPQFMINFRIPSKVCKIIPPNSITYLTAIMKTIHSMDWGLFIETIDINYGDTQNQSQDKQKKQQKQVRINEEVQVHSPEFGPQLPSYNNNNDMIACPTCTYLQSSSNHFCEICTQEFK